MVVDKVEDVDAGGVVVEVPVGDVCLPAFVGEVCLEAYVAVSGAFGWLWGDESFAVEYAADC